MGDDHDFMIVEYTARPKLVPKGTKPNRRGKMRPIGHSPVPTPIDLSLAATREF